MSQVVILLIKKVSHHSIFISLCVYLKGILGQLKGEKLVAFREAI